MKRIALFSITYNPFIGGAEVAIREITDRLSDFEFDLFTARLDPKLPNQEKIGVINVYRLGTGNKLWDKYFYPWRAAKLAIKIHQQKPYDLIHAVLETYAGLAALFFKKRFKLVPYILTLQSGDTDLFLWLRTWFWYPLYRQVYTQANKITAISLWLANRARRYGYKGPIEIVPNGVDIEHFVQEMKLDERAFVRKSWGIKEDAFVIVTASRLVHKNGVDTLIEAMSFLPQNVILVIAGSGEDEEKLKIKSEKLKGRVVFLGHIDHEFLPRVLKAADVFVRVSRSEGLGNAFLEAMAVGLPVIGTNVGGIVDFIKDHQTGLLVLPENPRELSRAILELVQNPNLKISLATAGETLAKDKYDWASIAVAYKNIYQI